MENKVEPWSNIKVKVVIRAFYEDAYLDFFIKYYTALGFDNITILKADADKFNYIPPQPTNLCSSNSSNGGGLESVVKNETITKVDIIPVINEGNDIMKTHYNYYADKQFDWILNVDADEFLIIDLGLYPSGIKEFIYKLGKRIEATKNIGCADDIQQIKFRWICINKLHNREYSVLSPENIVNNTIITPDKVTEIVPQSFAGYFLTNNLMLYSYVKSMCNTRWANSKKLINAHFFIPIIHPIGRYYNLLDGYFRGKNSDNPKYLPTDQSMLMDGYILHLNTRSLANAITKCLVTKLRDNKKIKEPEVFRRIVNNYTTQSDSNATNKIKHEFNEQLNSKSFFPVKVCNYHARHGHCINNNYLLNPLKNMINFNPSSSPSSSSSSSSSSGPSSSILFELVKSVPVCNQELEWQILHDLCVANNLNPENMKAIINLY